MCHQVLSHCINNTRFHFSIGIKVTTENSSIIAFHVSRKNWINHYTVYISLHWILESYTFIWNSCFDIQTMLNSLCLYCMQQTWKGYLIFLADCVNVINSLAHYELARHCTHFSSGKLMESNLKIMTLNDIKMEL